MRPIVGIDDGVNLYAYVGNDPINGTDPTGTEAAFVTKYSVCSLTGGSDCGAMLEPYAEAGKAFPFSGAAEQLDNGNYLAAGVLGAIDVGTGGKGRMIGSLGAPLGRALATAGRGAVKGLEQAHHIVPKGAMNEFAKQSREILRKAGIGIHDAVNGVALPKAFHSAQHTIANFRGTFNRLDSAWKGGGADAVKAELGKIGSELQEAAKKVACAAPTGSHIPRC